MTFTKFPNSLHYMINIVFYRGNELFILMGLYIYYKNLLG
jgi:hypothetical protein